MMIYTYQTSKKSKKQKAKQKEAWVKHCKKFGIEQRKDVFKPLSVETTFRRIGSEAYKTLESVQTDRFDTFQRQKNQYTGTAMIGVAAMHKSNLVPVFDSQHAEQVAKMRRG